jgi:threonine dehydrogenase-like Zn-dependent dehydrogenase
VAFRGSQVTGHEVVGELVDVGRLEDRNSGVADGIPVQPGNQLFAVEINASCAALGRGDEQRCAFCSGEPSTRIPSQCARRVTLGIDRLPGGFAQVLLAPQNALVPVPAGVQAETAVLWEPFAAALHAVDWSTPASPVPFGSVAAAPVEPPSAAVLGPRRLGMFLCAALVCRAREAQRSGAMTAFTPVAVARHSTLLRICSEVGIDDCVDLTKTPAVTRMFHTVFDTSGTSSGFLWSLAHAQEVLHLKSTCGESLCGLSRMTQFVVDELTLSRAGNEKLLAAWASRNDFSVSLFASSTVPEQIVDRVRSVLETTGDRPAVVTRGNTSDTFESIAAADPTAEARFQYTRYGSNGFDVAVIGSLAELDSVIRPKPGESERSLVRPRGLVLLAASKNESPDSPMQVLHDAIVDRNVVLTSSRCGDAETALAAMRNHPDIADTLTREMITHTKELAEINDALRLARDSKSCIKAIVDTT